MLKAVNNTYLRVIFLLFLEFIYKYIYEVNDSFCTCKSCFDFHIYCTFVPSTTIQNVNFIYKKIIYKYCNLVLFKY